MSKFDHAVQVSLSAGQSYVQALKDIDDLIGEVSEAVQRATDGSVTVESSPGYRKGSFSFKATFEGAAPEQDPQKRVVVARSKDGAAEILWKVKHSADGYPMTVIAQDDSVIMCVTREDLEQTFIDLLQQGIIGRRIRQLQEKSTKQAS
jgi:hypothetical protein